MSAPITNLMRAKHVGRRKVLGYMYDMLDGPGVENKNINTDAFALDGLTHGKAKDYTKEIEELGILRRRMEYGSPKNSMKPGRHYHYTLLVSRDEAFKILDRADVEELASADRNFAAAVKVAQTTRKQNRSAKSNGAERTVVVTEKPAVRTVKDEPVEAIAGPDQPSPFEALRPYRKDESYALVEAARQYKSRTSTIDQRINDLLSQAKELGLVVDESALRTSITFEQDERLESVALALPYIEQLESAIERLLGQISWYKDRRTASDLLKVENEKLREQNRRLLAAKIASA